MAAKQYEIGNMVNGLPQYCGHGHLTIKSAHTCYKRNRLPGGIVTIQVVEQGAVRTATLQEASRILNI